MKKKLLIGVVMCGIGFCATAQKKTEWTINVGASVPVGSFSHMQYDKNTGVTDCGLFDEDISGGATTGFNIGAKAMFPTKNEHLGFTIAMDVHYNGLNSNAKSFLSFLCNQLATIWGQGLSEGEVLLSSTCNLDKRPYYLNIPLMVGLNYSYPLTKEMKLFGELGAGFNIRYISPWKLTGVQKYIFANSSEDTWMQVKETCSYETVATFAFYVGAGLYFTDNLYLSVYYSFLGKGDVAANIEATLSAEYVQPYNANSQYLQLGSVNPSILSFNIGYTF
jgi:hypothetical protein